MSAAIDFLSGVLLLAGGFFCIVGGIGLLRLPDFFCRTHAGGLTDTLGAGCILLGLVFQAPEPLIAVKLFLILLFLFFTSPTAGHALVRAALAHGLVPLVGDDSFEESFREGPLFEPAPGDLEGGAPSD